VDLRDYLRIVRREWALIMACIVLGVAAGVGLTLATAKVYRADVQLFVAADSGTVDGTDAGLAQSNNFVQDRVQSYTSIATGPAVTKSVIHRYGLQLTPQQLADKISSDAPLNKVLINLHVTDRSPGTAARLANEVAKAFAKVVQTTEQTGPNGTSVVKLTVIHPATIPSSPVKPNKVLYIGLGFAAGLLFGLALVIIRDLLDTTVKGSADFDELGVAVLGMIPLDKRTPKSPIAFRADPHGTRAEAYRQLRTNLQFVNVDHAPRVIAVTSAVPGEGKSTTALNLAAALAEAGSRVCLIEADLRRPTIAATLGLVPDVGFTTVVIGKIAPQDALQNAGRNLAVLVCGPVPPNPSELLSSEHARDLIRTLADEVDYAIIDTAPLLPVADGAEVAALADATILVHHAGKTSKDHVARSVQALERIGERPVGAVLNMVTRRTGRYDYDDDYYYTYHPRLRRGREPKPVEPSLGADEAPTTGEVVATEPVQATQNAAAQPRRAERADASPAEPAPVSAEQQAPAADNDPEPDLSGSETDRAAEPEVAPEPTAPLEPVGANGRSAEQPNGSDAVAGEADGDAESDHDESDDDFALISGLRPQQSLADRTRSRRQARRHRAD
jgi:capsular exopolysaccharide synthesis family protein